MLKHKTIVYTQPGCPACHRETTFLAQKGVEFEEKNVREDSDSMQEMVRLGSQATPTTVIDGEVIIGFDLKRISASLGL
ncbi:MAG TPA: glutaredoxin domain-containing protein [Rubrobacter sp.]|nr:glutaredoxin domain-containing protein [Rubrobacter sp.]